YDGLVDIRLLDLDLVVLGRLDLERLVDQVAEHLLGYAIPFFCRDLSTIGDRKQLHPLLDVGLGDDLPVYNRRCLDDRRNGAAEHFWILRQAQGLRAVDWLLLTCGLV